MKPMHLSDIARMTHGRLHGEDMVIDAIATDTRSLLVGGRTLFVALKGERFDGHDHVAVAAKGGVVAALVSRVVDASIATGTLPQVVVADTQRALADFAAAVQRERSGVKVVGITGSNGKTSVKTLVMAILARAGRAFGFGSMSDVQHDPEFCRIASACGWLEGGRAQLYRAHRGKLDLVLLWRGGAFGHSGRLG